MRLVILTTETLHHCHFVRELAASNPVDLVIVERAHPVAPFDVHHAFEDQRDAHERATWFGDGRSSITEFSNTLEVKSANDADAIDRLRGMQPEVIVVYGTAKLSRGVIGTCPHGIINLHGGDPEHYRGLDSHLWAIYHSEYEHLKVTLHRVNERLDDGDVVSQRPLPLCRGMGIHELRRARSEVWVDVVRTALEQWDGDGKLTSRPQRQRGRYYSFMPAVLKELCKSKFEAYTRDL
jgi:methionyl-tRNA formyltransferase